MLDAKIYCIENFLSKEECDFFINYMEKHIDKFYLTEKTKRYTLLFGKDLVYFENMTEDLDRIKDIEDIVRKLFTKVEVAMKQYMENEKDLYVCSIFFAKQVKGSYIPLHYDTDDGKNMHMKYSGVIYLNEMSDPETGQLLFPNLGRKYAPKAGQIVMFPSHGVNYLHEVLDIPEDRYSIPIWLTEDPEWRIS